MSQKSNVGFYYLFGDHVVDGCCYACVSLFLFCEAGKYNRKKIFVVQCNFHFCREALNKLRQAIAAGRENKTTKRNKILSQADKELNKFSYELSTATAEVSCAVSTLIIVLMYITSFNGML